MVLTREELDRVRIILVGSRNPLNIGAAARAMSNFGFVHLRVVRPYELAFREARSAVDAEHVLGAAEEFDSLREAVSDCSLVVGTTGGARRSSAEPLFRLEEVPASVRAHLTSGARVALVFGSEKVGLSGQELGHCHLRARIPTRVEHPSMNLGQAVAVVLYELIRESGGEIAGVRIPEQQPLATSGEMDRLLDLMLEGLSIGGYAHGRTRASMEEKLRLLVRRLVLSRSDLHQWLGLARQLLWKLRKSNLVGKRQ